SLVAASMPALPEASRNSRPSRLYCAAKVSTSAVTRLRVSALWSSRKISTGASEQALLYRPSARAMELLRICWLRDSASHLRLPSFRPLMTCLDTLTSDTADCTPGVLSIFHISSSMADRVWWLEQPSTPVLTITTSTSELVE